MVSNEDQSPERDLAIRTRRAFLVMGVSAVAGVAGVRWMLSQPEVGRLAGPFRRVLQVNEQLASATFNKASLAPEFPPERLQDLRPNGDIGLGTDFDLSDWSLSVSGGDRPARNVTLADIRALPRVEHRTQLKCIEGWAMVNHFAGARFSDFTAKFAPESARMPYVSMQTPDQEYFVGLDMPSALHPQTLLCYEMNGAPLTIEHGAPLRLAIPVKYGIKNIKRIATIEYSAERPRDYWAQEGYDWYAGL